MLGVMMPVCKSCVARWRKLATPCLRLWLSWALNAKDVVVGVAGGEEGPAC